MDLRGFGLSEDDLRQLGYDVKRKSGGSGPGRGSGGLPARGVPPAAPRKWAPATRTWLATVGVLFAVGWASGTSRFLPAPVPTAAPDTAFSSGRAMAQLVDVARGARPTGSPEADRVREYLLGRLRSLGLEAEVQIATAVARDTALVRAATVRNVLGRIPGSAPTGALLLTAHYDSWPHSPGAADDGVGVATVLEVVRALAAGEPLLNDVVVLFTDGDELGGLGTRAFADAIPADSVAAVLAVEAQGPSGPAIAFEGGEGNGFLVDALAAAEPSPTALSLARPLRARALESGRSESPALAEGARALTFSPLGGAARQHLSLDARDRVSEATLQHGGRQLLAVTRSLGGIDLRDAVRAPDRVYLTVRPIGLLDYPRGWVLPTSLGLLAFWVLTGLVLRGRLATRRGVAIGLATGLGAIAAGAALGRATRDMTSGLHPEYGVLRTAYYEDGLHVLAILALVVAASALLLAIARRWARSDEIVYGGLTVPLLGSVWLAITEPSAAPALQLPLAVTMLAGGLVIVAGPNRARSVWAWAALLALTAVGVALAVPSLELLAGVWTLRSAGEIGAVLGLSALMLWPLMERLLLPRWWWTPAAGLVAAGTLIAVSLPLARASREHPVPTTLVYLADQPVSAAPALAPSVPADTSRVRSMAGKWLTIPGPGEDWARSWAGEAATGPTDAGVLLLGSLDARYEIVGSAPVTELAPPLVSVVSIAPEGAGRTVELAVARGLAGEMVGLHVPEGAPGVLVGVEGVRWSPAGPAVRSLSHWGAPSGGAARFAVHVDPGVTELTLVVVEHLLRPREVVGSYFFQRPDSMIPNPMAGSDRAIQRTQVRVALQAPQEVTGEVTEDSPDG